jgi:hypothetical protein
MLGPAQTRTTVPASQRLLAPWPASNHSSLGTHNCPNQSLTKKIESQCKSLKIIIGDPNQSLVFVVFLRLLSSPASVPRGGTDAGDSTRLRTDYNDLPFTNHDSLFPAPRRAAPLRSRASAVLSCRRILECTRRCAAAMVAASPRNPCAPAFLFAPEARRPCPFSP